VKKLLLFELCVIAQLYFQYSFFATTAFWFVACLHTVKTMQHRALQKQKAQAVDALGLLW
jgi:hypothetical protein